MGDQEPGTVGPAPGALTRDSGITHGLQQQIDELRIWLGIIDQRHSSIVQAMDNITTTLRNIRDEQRAFMHGVQEVHDDLRAFLQGVQETRDEKHAAHLCKNPKNPKNHAMKNVHPCNNSK